MITMLIVPSVLITTIQAALSIYLLGWVSWGMVKHIKRSVGK